MFLCKNDYYESNMQRAYSYQEISLVPDFFNGYSRSECDTRVQFLGREFNLPVIPANMRCSISQEWAKWLSDNGYFYIMHRFNDSFDKPQNHDNYEFIKYADDNMKFTSISLGVTNIDKEFLLKVVNEGLRLDFITLDIAHGDSIQMKEMIQWVKAICPKAKIIAGNVVTPESIKHLKSWGCDAIKVGIAQGCFAAGTRILTANGTYKDIEKLTLQDKIIDGNGCPVRVLSVKNSGKKSLIKYRHNKSIGYTYCTEDHLHSMLDCNDLRESTFQSKGWKKILEDSPDRLKWKQVGEIYKQDLLTLPSNIKFELADNFNIDLSKYSIFPSRSNLFKQNVMPTYDLGYIFGAFLGDGHSKVCLNTKNGKNSTSASVHFSYGKNEINIAQKTVDCLLNSFGLKSTISNPKNKNITLVNCYSVPLAKFLKSFYDENDEKYLPNQFLVYNKSYLQGLIDGLIDSDGSISENRKAFANTSKRLIELFNVCVYLLNGYWPSVTKPEKRIGTLENISAESCKDFYVSSFSDKFDDKCGSQYSLVQPLEIELTNTIADVYDIEVESNSHSFIANNCIVHNSACSTFGHTGFGMPMFSCVEEVYNTAVELDVPIIADGGIKTNGDFAKAIRAGGTMVMAGSVFAACINSPAENVYEFPPMMAWHEGKRVPVGNGAGRIIGKKYFGSASQFNKGGTHHIEGRMVELECNGLTLEQKIQEIREDLQSAISYAGGFTLDALKSVRYRIIDNR